MKNYIPKKDLKVIADLAVKALANASTSGVSWKQSCNRLHDAIYNGKQMHVYYKGRSYQILKCSAVDKVFVDLFQGESANVAVGLDGKLCHHLGGMLIR